VDTVYLNGEYLPRAEARVAADDRGFLLSDGIYEVTPAYGGRFFRGDRHLARMTRGLAALRIFYRLGMRHLQLHWATRNQVGTAQSDTDEPGLTEFGREVVAEVNSLGMLLDVSHSSTATIADVLAITDRPVINSHTGARELNPRSPQLLWDDQIKDLADNGGVAAVHFCSRVLLDDGHTTIDDVLTHIDYLVDMGGIESVGLGPDYLLDGTQRTRNVSFNQRIPEGAFTWAKDFEDTSTLPNVTVALLERGYTEDETLKILGGNMLRVIEASLP